MFWLENFWASSQAKDTNHHTEPLDTNHHTELR